MANPSRFRLDVHVFSDVMKRALNMIEPRIEGICVSTVHHQGTGW